MKILINSKSIFDFFESGKYSRFKLPEGLSCTIIKSKSSYISKIILREYKSNLSELSIIYKNDIIYLYINLSEECKEINKDRKGYTIPYCFYILNKPLHGKFPTLLINDEGPSPLIKPMVDKVII